MRKLVSTKDMPREQWLEYRRKSIGGSEAATIAGLNQYSSLYALWADKMGLLPEKEDNEQMRQGRDFENYVAQRWSEATGKKVRRTNFMYLHDDYDYISANVDREVVGENAGLECKTTSVFNKSDFENGEIPLYYYVQCVHYMNVMGYNRMYLAVLILNKGFYHFVIERDEVECNELLQLEIEFWQKYVETKIPPYIDGSEATEEALKNVYPDDNGEERIIYDSEQDIEQYMKLKENIKEIKAQADKIEQSIKLKLGDAAKGVAEKYTVTWKSQSRTTVDSKKLKNTYPEVYEKVTKTGTSRVFKVQKLKEA